ncbi:MAG: CopG family ribbon-helix-helix protein [Gammaproteobacteria bacterium]
MSASTTSLRIDKELFERLKKLAEATGRPKSWYIRQALEVYLSQEEWMVEAIQEGIRAADAGELASEKEVRAAFAKWGVDVGGSVDRASPDRSE